MEHPDRGALDAIEDGALVALCRRHGRRDERLFSELFRRHRQLVWSVTRRYFRNREDIADIVQDVFFRAFRSLEGYRGTDDRQFRGWLVQIAANTCKNELRRRARRPRLDEDEPEPSMSMVEAPQGDALEASDRHALLHRVLATLSAAHRETIELADIRQLPYPEIAKELGLSVSAVKMRVVRARASLAGAFGNLEKEGAQP